MSKNMPWNSFYMILFLPLFVLILSGFLSSQFQVHKKYLILFLWTKFWLLKHLLFSKVEDNGLFIELVSWAEHIIFIAQFNLTIYSKKEILLSPFTEEELKVHFHSQLTWWYPGFFDDNYQRLFPYTTLPPANIWSMKEKNMIFAQVSTVLLHSSLSAFCLTLCLNTHLCISTRCNTEP